MGETVRLFEETASSAVMQEAMRIAEALLFASKVPLGREGIARRLPQGVDIAEVLDRLRHAYAHRGVNLVQVAGGWAFRTADDLSWLLAQDAAENRKLSRAAMETLAIIAYHQPTTRAEIEDIRGVGMSKGTLDTLLQTGWIRLRGRRKAPGRPLTYGTTPDFLSHFGLDNVGDLPGLDDLKGAGLFESQLPRGFGVPSPNDDVALGPEEEPLGDDGPDTLDEPLQVDEETPETERPDVDGR